ncbi:MAG: hypothetical protein HY537_08750 [Deltaproteobacteria bacterium]|nr:hypothetical protein [Deltaproteobacteria bacterium]
MRSIVCLLFTLCVSVCSLVQGAEVLTVGKRQRAILVSRDLAKQWQVGDSVCVIQRERTIACGKVLKHGSSGSIIKIERRKGDIEIGSKVELASGRSLAMLEESPKIAQHTSQVEFQKRLNVSAGMNVTAPFAHVQLAISDWTIGIMPTYASMKSSSGSITGMGGLLTASYYPNQLYKGLWLMAGAGYYSFALTIDDLEERGGTLAVAGAVGWRFLLNSGLNVGLGVGGQFLTSRSTATLSAEFSGFLPAALLDIGFLF